MDEYCNKVLNLSALSVIKETVKETEELRIWEMWGETDIETVKEGRNMEFEKKEDKSWLVSELDNELKEETSRVWPLEAILNESG